MSQKDNILEEENVLPYVFENMPAGRKKKPRCLTLKMDDMICQCFGPLQLSCDELEQRPRIFLEADELQTLIYQDIDKLTMQIASSKMGISKTVYAGLYASARHKVTQALISGSVLMVRCP